MVMNSSFVFPLQLEKNPGAVEDLLLQVFVPVTENIKRAEVNVCVIKVMV